ncbi:M48 family metallopeptidase [Octadecabacter sp.]|nr:M48 family metallopeptidase [Octadecabacter sp.]
MRLATILVGFVFVLAGCEVVSPVTQPEQVQPAAVATPAPDTPRSNRAIARSFVRVLDEIEPVAERECRRRAPRLNCDFLITVDPRPDQPANAFQTIDEDGRPIIAFTLALIADARNADEVAFIMAHEAAHHIENHLEQQQRNATIGAAVFGRLAGAGGGSADDIRTAQEIGAVVGARSYSRDFELEADRLGTIIAAKAGYDPVRGAEFFFRIPDPGDQFLGTHPPNAERVQVVNETAAGL